MSISINDLVAIRDGDSDPAKSHFRGDKSQKLYFNSGKMKPASVGRRILNIVRHMFVLLCAPSRNGQLRLWIAASK